GSRGDAERRAALREIERADYDIFAARPVVPTWRKLRVLLGMQLRAPFSLRSSRRSVDEDPGIAGSAHADSTLPPVSPLD
ncbi:MAG: hypothetical protein RRA94_10490, partial [Bacteroidota bacterium]|nr:hypothetical protein [Bacteroidota bacterium]